MSATLTIDHISGGYLSVDVEQGVKRQATRTALVKGVTSSTADAIYTEIMGVSGMPQYGDSYPGDDNLICVSHRIKSAGAASNRQYLVDIDYSRLADDDGQFIFHGTSSVSESQTNADRLGNAVVVTYTYPADYPNPLLAGKTQSYSPKMVFQEPQQNEHTTGIIATASIQALVASWSGYANSTAWHGFPAGCWLCTNVTWEPHDLAASPPKYKVTFEFQLRKRGWGQTVYFHNDQGEIPSDIVYGLGYKFVTVQGYRDFTERFPDA